MTRLACLCFAVALLAAACGSNESEPPPGLLTKDQFTALMIDMQLAEALRTHRSPGIRIPDASHASLYDDIFARHDVNRELFLETHAWYREHPELMELIYEAVIDTLTRREAALKQRYTQQILDERAAGDTLRRKTEGNTPGMFRAK